MTLIPFGRRSSAKERLRGGMTAKEGMEILMSDPEYVATIEEKEHQIDRNIREFNAAAAPLKAELARVGFPVEKLGSLFFNFRPEHRVFIPILIKWLPRLDNREVKETIVRLLTDRMARPVAARPMIEEFKRTPSTEPWMLHYKTAIASGLAVVADDSVFDETVALLRDRDHGWSRGMLCIALGRMKHPLVEDVLLEILERERNVTPVAVTRSAIRALGNRKSSRAKPVLAGFLDHPEPLVRKEAQKSLDKIARAEQKAREKRMK